MDRESNEVNDNRKADVLLAKRIPGTTKISKDWLRNHGIKSTEEILISVTAIIFAQVEQLAIGEQNHFE